MRTLPVPYQKIPQGEGKPAFTIDERGAAEDVFVKNGSLQVTVKDHHDRMTFLTQ